jgi:hypothetical protein
MTTRPESSHTSQQGRSITGVVGRRTEGNCSEDVVCNVLQRVVWVMPNITVNIACGQKSWRSHLGSANGSAGRGMSVERASAAIASDRIASAAAIESSGRATEDRRTLMVVSGADGARKRVKGGEGAPDAIAALVDQLLAVRTAAADRAKYRTRHRAARKRQRCGHLGLLEARRTIFPLWQRRPSLSGSHFRAEKCRSWTTGLIFEQFVFIFCSSMLCSAP